MTSVIVDTGPLVALLAFDHSAAEEFGTIAAALATSGQPIGQMDTLIAGHALAANATLVTNNQRQFSKVNGLKIENWA